MILSIFDWTPIQSFFLWLNKGVYWLAEKAYSLLLDIANVQLFEPDVISGFGERIYVLLGIVMLFKLSFSFISYIVNPDSFTDKSKGVSKLIMNIIVSLLLIVTTPFIFQAAYKLQGLILENNVIPNLLLGMGSETDSDTNEEGYDYIEEGERMSFLVFTSFFKPNPAIFEDGSVCHNTLFAPSDGADVDADSENNNDLLSQIGSDELEVLAECKEPLDGSKGTSFDDHISDVLALAYETNNMNLLTDTDLIKAKYGSGDNAIWTFEFNGIVSLIAAAFMAWIFIMFCFDIAVRVVKLAFLQIIAPVPIIAYADPKGQGMFKKWVKQCVSTYFDLFIRLVAIFFAIFIISNISQARIVSDGSSIIQNGLVYIFLILGTLLFAKQLPKLLSDITGAKLDGGFTLNPMNKLRQTPILAKTAAGLTGLAVGAGVGVAAARESGTSKLRGATKGALYGRKEAANKFSVGGGDGKKQGIISSSGNRAMRELVGHDFAQQSFLRKWGTKEARERDEKLKRAQGIYGQQIGAINANNTLLSAKQESSYAEAKDIVQKFGGDTSTFRTIEDAVRENKIDKLNGNDRFIYEQAKQQFDEYFKINEEIAANNKTISDYQRNIEDLGKERASVKASAGLDDVKKSKADKLVDEAIRLNQK